VLFVASRLGVVAMHLHANSLAAVYTYRLISGTHPIDLYEHKHKYIQTDRHAHAFLHTKIISVHPKTKGTQKTCLHEQTLANARTHTSITLRTVSSFSLSHSPFLSHTSLSQNAKCNELRHLQGQIRQAT